MTSGPERLFLDFSVISMVLSGVSAFFIYLVTSQLTNLIISCVFGAVSTMGFNALDCLSAELFPTELRSPEKFHTNKSNVI